MLARDPHSFARPDEVVVRHLDLDLTADFAARRLAGSAALTIENLTGAPTLHLDSRDLAIERVAAGTPGAERPVAFTLGAPLTCLGRRLEIELPPGARRVTVDYATGAEAAALQWLSPEQTAGGRRPFLFTQSQAILARTWIPCQDTPGVRMTYSARLRVPEGLLALMSAENPRALAAGGVYRFAMPQAIPSYLMALAVGDLAFRPLGERSGVYAEPPTIEAAAWELADTEAMIAAAERLYGPYRWGRYDLLVLPPSFPFGGMENPRLTFATPTILAGDRSLVSLVAHELAHSWSGNLVTNATWNDFWLNEGVTTYFEGRIMEEIYGREHAEMLAALGRQDLLDTFERLGGAASPDTRLRLDLAGRDPDEGMSDVAYEKGAAFLRLCEATFGRPRWDAFLRAYFERHAFRSMDTDGFLVELRRELVRGDAALERELSIEAWIDGPGLPENAPEVDPAAFLRVEREVAAWRGGRPAAELAVAGWSTQQWLCFLRSLPKDLDAAGMARLDAAFHLTDSGNAEILSTWLLRAVGCAYAPADAALERFLTGVGRRKFVKPLYAELAKSEAGKARAVALYRRARPGYHPVTRAAVDRLLGWGG